MNTNEDKKPKGWEKFLMATLTSDKFIKYISSANLSDLLRTALQVPGIKGKMTETLTKLGGDLKERYEITDYSSYVDKNKYVIILNIESEEMRDDFVAHFQRFIRDSRQRFEFGFDMFIKAYKISSISCKNEDGHVKIEVHTPRSADLESVASEIQKLVR